ncbi:translesion DNA synthesis-associated protein ImuA [Arenimonas oryziterrae]|uniref:CDP-6-deoxy-delta-3,4-glucoseen reductase n=1 Tax=Arenimonas oryziterrae DSM 21050 = YC6267 TaxID=1121015 RepID=A0A091AMB8_9GAMM|nr:translesion DNA synthesis-associated protein ImuA [Arenimonas oryziterrae]KFN41348.1 hypothetical protein N789_05600 [Arenimonas oryziterrae DSM 21050 = YC6267]
MGQVVALDSLLRDQRIWRGHGTAPAVSKQPTGFAALDEALPTLGWPEASLVEILLASDGIGELALVLPTLARLSSAGKPIVVIAPPYRPYVPAWQHAGVALSQLQILDASPRDALWAMEQVLRAGCAGAVLGWPMKADDHALRRLQVAAETGQTLGFVFRAATAANNPSPAPLRLSMTSTPRGGDVRVLKCRGGLPPPRPIALPPRQRC